VIFGLGGELLAIFILPKKKGLQLALKPLNGRSIAGYVLKP
jgi:hypothetical protein